MWPRRMEFGTPTAWVKFTQAVGVPNSDFLYDLERFLIHRSILDAPLLKVVTGVVQGRNLYLAHYSKLQ